MLSFTLLYDGCDTMIYNKKHKFDLPLLHTAPCNFLSNKKNGSILCFLCPGS